MSSEPFQVCPPPTRRQHSSSPPAKQEYDYNRKRNGWPDEFDTYLDRQNVAVHAVSVGTLEFDRTNKLQVVGSTQGTLYKAVELTHAEE